MGGRKSGPQTQSPAQPPKPTLPLSGSFSKFSHRIVTKRKSQGSSLSFPSECLSKARGRDLFSLRTKKDMVRSSVQRQRPPRGRCLGLAPMQQPFSGLRPKDPGRERCMRAAPTSAPHPSGAARPVWAVPTTRPGSLERRKEGSPLS